jgi:hypothetical protein
MNADASFLSDVAAKPIYFIFSILEVVRVLTRSDYLQPSLLAMEDSGPCDMIAYTMDLLSTCLQNSANKSLRARLVFFQHSVKTRHVMLQPGGFLAKASEVHPLIAADLGIGPNIHVRIYPSCFLDGPCSPSVLWS